MKTKEKLKPMVECNAIENENVIEDGQANDLDWQKTPAPLYAQNKVFIIPIHFSKHNTKVCT